MKTCSCCKKSLDESNFGKKSHYRDGLNCYCKPCQRNLDKRKYDERKSNGWKKIHSEQVKQYNREYYHKNKERVKEVKASYDAKLEVKKRKNFLKKTRYKALNTFSAALRRKAARSATPKWLTIEQKEEMKLFYKSARSMTEFHEIQFEVDHIEPILGETSCGLNVPWNLQVITADENRRKSNKLIV